MKKLLLLILLPISVFAQKDTSFWFAAPDVTEFNVSNPYDRPILLRLTTFSIAATVTVSIPANISFVPITISINPNSTGTINLSNWANLIENSVANTIADKGIKISSTAEITAYYEINSSCNCNPELFALKGKNALGNEFIIPSQAEWSVDTVRHPTATSAFNIVATENNTVVNILPSKTLVGRSPNVLFSIILNKGQTFSSQALYRSAASLLNGSIVTSDKPIAVTADEDLLMADGTCADLAGDQLIPTAIWGNEFIVVKGNLTNKDKIVITASVNGTSIFLDGNSTAAAIINRGNAYEINLAAAPTLYIKTSKNVSVYHYTGISCEIGSAVIPKISCTGSFDVAITRSSNESAVVFLVTKNGNQSAFTVNGNSTVLTSADFLPVPGTAGNYVYCKKNLDFIMPTGNTTRFINTLGKFQIGFLNGGTTYGGCSYGFFSDFKSSNVARSQLEICKLDSAQLNAFGGISYQWSPSTGLSNTNSANPKASPSITTDYKVIITTAEGCIDSAFIKVLINTTCVSTAIPCNTWLNTPSSPSYVNVGDLDVPGNKITVEAIFNRTTPYTGGVLYAGNLVSKHDFPTTVNYLLRPNTAEITTSNGYFRTPDICDIELNKTYHAAMVYDGTTLKFYRDGFLMSQVAVTGNLVQNDLQTRIGWLDFTAANENFIGYINEVRIWNVAKTKSEINTYINTTLPNPAAQPGLLAYYSFDNLLNKQGNATYNGILGGSASINQTNPDCAYIADSCFVTAPISSIINSYTPVINLNICQNKITVEDASTFNIGDTVLIIQMKGAVIDSTNTASFGSIGNYNNAGNYEFNYVKNRSGNIVELKNALMRQYEIGTGKVQLIRVPYYNSITISNILTCLPWDGSKGGVLVFNVRDSIIMNADMNVSGKGFAGGKSPNPGSNTLYCAQNNYTYPVGSLTAAAKGEGITTIRNNILWGKGAPANAGGGGNGHNSGGGGGANAGAGGLGGYQLLTCGNAPFDNRGKGGYALTYNNAQNKIFMGGGGGSGHVDNAGGSPMNGGYGGGIIIINSPVIKSNNNKIIANGADAPQCTLITFSDCHDASGGGGAGGTILIKNNSYSTPTAIEAKAGKGGDVIVYNPSVGADKIGPGGGGGGGLVWLSNPALPSNVNTNINAGLNGVISLDANNPWGATAGTAGNVLFNLALPISTNAFAPNIDSVRIKDSATNCNTFDFKGLAFIRSVPVAQWQWSFGDAGTANTQNTSHNYLTTGSYTVKLIITDLNGCKDSITKIVNVTGIKADFFYNQNTCNPLSVQFFNIGNSPSNTYWSFGDGNTITGSTSPVHVYAATGNYIVKYGFQNGTCTDTVIKNISINILQSNIILTADTTICFKSSKQLLTVPALSFCWSPTSFLNDPLSPNPITSTPGSITYYFTAEIPGINIINNGNFSAGNTGFTSAYNYAVTNTTEGEYFVGPSPQAWNASLSNCSDHTTGTGNMLLVNGSPAPNVKVWTQTVTVTPNTNYAFSSWIQALYPPNPAQLSFSINGADVGNLITASLPPCNWTQFYTTWNSGNSTSALIAIINKNTQVQGNDFALDDISFAPVLIKRDSVKITIDSPFVKTLTDTATCKGNPVQLTSTGAAQYSWTPSAGLNNASASNPIATPADTTQYIVTGTNARGCIAKDTVMVFVKKLPVISRSANDTVCINQSAQLFATGGVNYSWLPANSLNNAGIANPIATPAATTTYTVVVTGANNCVNTDSVKITTKPKPAFTINADTATCVNGKAQLNAGGGTSYLWSPASMLNNATIANPVATVSANTNFTVIIKDNICNLADTLFTNVSTDLALPDIVAAKSNDMDCVFNSVQLSVTGADVYVWTPAIDLSSAAIANPVATPTVSRQYKVVGTNITNNCSSSDTITVFAKAPAGPKSYIPNSFTPNGDGVNDCFKVGDFGTIKTVDITIYNRYGNVVFHTKNATHCWDGKYKGQPAEVGNYVYYIKVLNNCGEEIKKGNLLLFR